MSWGFFPPLTLFCFRCCSSLRRDAKLLFATSQPARAVCTPFVRKFNNAGTKLSSGRTSSLNVNYCFVVALPRVGRLMIASLCHRQRRCLPRVALNVFSENFPFRVRRILDFYRHTESSLRQTKSNIRFDDIRNHDLWTSMDWVNIILSNFYFVFYLFSVE